VGKGGSSIGWGPAGGGDNHNKIFRWMEFPHEMIARVETQAEGHSQIEKLLYLEETNHQRRAFLEVIQARTLSGRWWASTRERIED